VDYGYIYLPVLYFVFTNFFFERSGQVSLAAVNNGGPVNQPLLLETFSSGDFRRYPAPLFCFSGEKDFRNAMSYERLEVSSSL